MLCVNAYWLGVFLDYTLNKAASLDKTSTFVEVNEIQQNKALTDFSWRNILTLKPDLQSAEPTKIADGTKVPLHPTLNNYYSQKSLYAAVVAIFPLLFLTGLAVAVVKKERKLLWAVITVVIFVLLARKTLTPLGFLYERLINYVPLLDVIFRFPDTKYYPLLALAGSLLAGNTIYYFTHTVNKRRLQNVLAAVIFLLNVCAFYPYFTGQFVNPTMFVKIPQQYLDVAKTVNSASNFGRFIHLPNEKVSYWKSYMWGYIGSDFMGYMLNKPNIDRAYEPASPENDQFNKTLHKLVKNPDNYGLIANLLERASVKYVLWDETVNPLVYSRGRKYWGTFNHDVYNETIKSLAEKGLLSVLSSGQVDITEYLRIYKFTEKLHPDLIKYLTENKYLNTTLYERTGTTPNIVSSIEKAEYVSNLHSNLLERPFLAESVYWVQKKHENSGLIFPFYLKNLKFTQTSSRYSAMLGTIDNKTVYSTATSTPNSQLEQAVLLKAKMVNQTMVLGFYLYSPFGKETLIKELVIPMSILDLKSQGNVNDYASDWWTLPFDQVSNSRLALGKTIIPLPPLSFYQSYYQNVATVLSEDAIPTVAVFIKQTSENLNLWEFELTDKPNCYKDLYPREDYLSELNKVEGSITLTTENGSSCITNPATKTINRNQEIVDMQPNYSIHVENTEKTGTKEKVSAVNTSTYKYIIDLPTYNYIDFCLTNTLDGSCLNNHKTVQLESRRKYTIPQTVLAPGSKNTPQLVASIIPVGFQKINFTLDSVLQTTYRRVYTTSLAINSSVEAYQTQDLGNLSIPKILSTDSYYFNSKNDAYLTFNQPCQLPGGYRTTRKLDNGFITYLRQCDHGVGLTLNYNPQGFYLWALGYNLLAGKDPKFTLNDGENEYMDEYVLLNDSSFPNIPDFKRVQNQSYNADVSGIVSRAPYRTAYAYIYPNIVKAENKAQLFAITQNSQGEGIIKYNYMDIVRLPNSWAETKITYGNPLALYGKLDISQITKYLPSLWRIEIAPNPSSTTQEAYLLEFNQAYDKNWKLYQNIQGVIFGSKEVKAEHVKINGLINGWEINKDQLKKGGSTTIYILYIPERLGIAGWIVTISTLLILGIIAVGKKQPPHAPISQALTEK